MSDVLRSIWELLNLAMASKWNGIPIAGLVELALAGGMLWVVSQATSPRARAARATRALAVRRQPGWLARRRARRGLRHPRGRIAVGCRSAFGVVYLTLAELAGHGLAVGGPKSGKTAFLRLLIEAAAGRLPVVVLDPKGSPELAAMVRALGRWIAAGALDQAEVEDALYVAALHNGLVRDDGQRQTWATIRSGLGAGLQQPIDLDADRGS